MQEEVGVKVERMFQAGGKTEPRQIGLLFLIQL